ncbi:NUDIX hydrolase [Phycicoccus mangrovi]|uniref:NUDIX hydrolase n=1 Tax=Phycicoccus mangrovi TaxID=2840470 RepID=UPI001D01DFEA|nr:NUDIX domain-containing protein [Phycicoccus mangrovi]
MGRIDYIDDPDAPVANSVVPSVVAIVRDEAGRLLLIHKTDNNLWALPGGGHEIGESISETVVREVKEETGYDVAVEAITGTYTNPRHIMAYDDGEVRQQFSIAFVPVASVEKLARVTRAAGSSGSVLRTSLPWTYTRRCGYASGML